MTPGHRRLGRPPLPGLTTPLRPLAALLALSIALLTACGPAASESHADLEALLRFEAGADSTLGGWGGGPADTLAIDRETVRSGTGSGRIVRDSASQGDFSSLTQQVDMLVEGQRVELRGFLSTAEVTGTAGLWMRQDGPSGSVQFTSMLAENRGISGTSDWTEYSIDLKLDADARRLVFGFLLSGEGTVWGDDLEILVDGKPISDAPERVIEPTILDSDTQFDGGSGVAVSTLDPVQIENLALLGRVWGFLKYHHPRIAAGESHWDYELFRVLPGLLEAESREQANAALTRWVQELGVPSTCDPCAEAPTDIHLAPDIDWIRDTSLLSEALARDLVAVHTNRFAGTKSFFVSHVPQVGNPIFANELAYPTSGAPDSGFRLLALFRLWNIIEYWFPYRDQLDQDWSAVLEEFVPRMVSATDLDSYLLDLLAFVVRIGDGHANLGGAFEVRPPVGDCRWPLRVRFVEGHPTVARIDTRAPLAPAGIEVGDVIVTIDGRPVGALVDEWMPYYAGSNPGSRLRAVARSMPRGECGPSSLEIERSGENRTIEIERTTGGAGLQPPHDRPGPTFQRLSDQIAYLKLSTVKAAEVDSYLEQAAGTVGLVIDLRNYPSDFVVFALGGRLVDEATPFARFTRGEAANPGAFTWTEPLKLAKGRPAYPGKVAILVNEVALSSAEYHAMALRAGPRAVVVGSPTAGADGNVSPIPLPGGFQTMISGIGVFYPDETPTQRVGIVPDIVARPTIEGIRAGRDEVLEAALRHLLGPTADEAKIRALAQR